MTDSQTTQNRIKRQPVDELEAITVFESDDLSMLILEAETGRIVDANAAAIRLFDLTSEYGDLNLSAYLSLTPDQFYDTFREAERLRYLEFRDHHAPSATGRRELRLQGGLLRWREHRCVFVIAHESTGMELGVHADEDAPLDPLTGLPNKVLQGKFCGSVLDLDYFKNVNDTFGHLAGDELLKDFAERLRGFVMATDTATNSSSW